MINRNLTDRVAMYRWAALILTVSMIRSFYTLLSGDIPFTGWRVVLWTGWTVLMVAVIRDVWGIYVAKRKMHKAIRQAMEDGPQQEEV